LSEVVTGERSARKNRGLKKIKGEESFFFCVAPRRPETRDILRLFIDGTLPRFSSGE
jgi:hypothetical protein